MSQSIPTFLQRLSNHNDDIDFNEVIALIDQHYDFTPTLFTNGEQRNEAGENSGSCKVFSFALLHSLSEDDTLALFAQYYRDVKASPAADDHQNIRQFMLHGFERLQFDGAALSLIKQ